MTEDDTFKALKKWTWAKVEAAIRATAEVTLEAERIRVAKIFEVSGWARNEYIKEYNRRC